MAAPPVPLPVTSDLYDPAPPIAQRVSSDISHAAANTREEEVDLERQRTHHDAADVEEQIMDLKQVKTEAPSEFVYPPFRQAFLVMIGLYFSIFLIAIDRTILGVAIPAITNEFNSFQDIAWYQSAYMLTTAGFQLLFGRIYTFYSPKWTFIASIVIFEAGSAMCGAAPSSKILIGGRALSGIGGAGMFNGSMVIMLNILPLEKRPLFMGLIGGIFGVASVVGPLLGGVFTSSHLTWRWCFYINLPIGAVTVLILVLVLRKDFTMSAAGRSTRQKILQLDPLGGICFLPALICLLLALQWGGSTYAWSSGRIIALLVLFPVLLITFMVLQFVRSEDQVTIPIRLLKNRNILGASWFAFFGGGLLVASSLYLPIWFQAIQGTSPVQSGIRIIPLILGMVVFIILSGALVQRFGQYVPFMILGSVVMSIGAGLVSTLKVDSGRGMWIGYQVLLGAGMGLSLQQPNLAAQAVTARADSSLAVSIVILSQTLGGAVWAAVAQTVLNNSLIKHLTQNPVPGILPQSIVNAGATSLRSLVPKQYFQAFLVTYNAAIMDALKVGVGLGCATLLGVLAMQWISVKKKKPAAKPEEKVLEQEMGAERIPSEGQDVQMEDVSVKDKAVV